MKALITLFSLSVLPWGFTRPTGNIENATALKVLNTPIYSDRPTTSVTTLTSYLAKVAQAYTSPQSLQEFVKSYTNLAGNAAYLMGIQVSQNDVVNGNCGNLIIFFARGTAEPGNVGSLVGPELFEGAKAVLKGKSSLAVQGVDQYSATAAEYETGGSASGSKRLSELITMAVNKCPTSKIAVTGYSQGAQVVHKALDMTSPEVVRQISSVVTWGDAASTRALPVGQSKVFCSSEDDICHFGSTITPAHLNYGSTAIADAVDFILKAANLI